MKASMNAPTNAAMNVAMNAAGYLTHIAMEGETWDALAYRYYGDAARYVPIVDANPHVPLVAALPAGVRLIIPLLPAASTESSEALPPWMR